jgi:putative permease
MKMQSYKIKNRKLEIGRIVFFFSILAIMGFILFKLPRLSLPFILSYVLFLILDPLVMKLKKLRMRSTLAVCLVMLGFVFLAAYPIFKVVPLINEESNNLQIYIPKVEGYISANYQKFSSFLKSKYDFNLDQQYLHNMIDSISSKSEELILNIPSIMALFLEITFIVPLFLFFMLKDKRQLKHLVLGVCPNKIFERFYFLFYELNKNIGDYIFAKIVEAFIVGLMITLGLIVLDVKFALILGVVAGITNIIPYLGPLLGIVPALVVAFIEYGPSSTTGAILLIYLIANAIDLALVFPILVSKIVDLHPVLVVVSVILGSQYLGLAGMIVSIPLAAAAKLLVTEIYQEFYGARLKN